MSKLYFISGQEVLKKRIHFSYISMDCHYINLQRTQSVKNIKNCYLKFNSFSFYELISYLLINLFNFLLVVRDYDNVYSLYIKLLIKRSELIRKHPVDNDDKLWEAK